MIPRLRMNPLPSISYIDYAVPTAGTYYVGVSSYANFDYDPTIPGNSTGFSTGDYTLEIVLNDGDDAGVHIVTLGPDEQVDTIDFGNFELPPGSISGRQWNDLNGDGFVDANEPGLANWTVYLDQNQNGELDDGELTTLTDATGAYTFSDLPENTYTVAPLLPDTWQQTVPGIASGQVVTDPLGDTFGFGATPLDIISTAASVSGTNLLLDMNFATSITAPSTGLPESVVGYWDLDLDQDVATGVPSNQSVLAPPDQQGGPLGVDAYIDLYSESFQPGFVDIINPSNSTFLGTASITYGTTSLQIAVPLSLLGGDSTLNYGTIIGTNTELTDAAPNSAFGTLSSGTTSVHEAGTATLQATSRDRLPLASPPSLTVEPPDVAPPNVANVNKSLTVSPTTPPITPALVTPTLTGTYSVELAAGEDISDVYFGNWQPAIVAGTKWHDLNENGVQENDEPGLADWTLFIDSNQNGTLDAGEQSTITDANGDYTFALQAGTYTVAEVLQPGWFATTPDDGSYTVSLQSGESADALDFGSQELPAAIAGQLWHDLNGNSQLDPNEPGLPDWVVYLDENQNNQLDAGETSTVTGPNGEYSFEGLFSGTYVVAEVLPDSWLQTSPGLSSSFETNDFQGWETIGDARIETSNFGVVPTDGEYQALLTNGSSSTFDPVPVDELEAFLGLNPGDLAELSTGVVTEGAAMKQTVTVAAGTTLTFDWNFLTNEGNSLTYNDSSFVTITDTTTDVLASATSPLVISPTLFERESGYETFTHTFTTNGTFTVGLGVANVTDGVVDSGLLIDNLAYSGNFTNGSANVVTLGPGEAVANINFGNLLNTGTAPVFEAETFTFTVLEGQPAGTVLGLLPATDSDADQTLSYSILSGNEAGVFALDSTTGALTVIDSAGLDFEAGDAPFELIVQVIDNGFPALLDTATVAIDVLNVNEAPVIDTSNGLVFDVNENSTVGTFVGLISAGDPEGALLTYSLTAGNDAGIFAINNVGYLTVADNTVLDFEAGATSYTLELTVSDDLLSTTIPITINLTDENEAPHIPDQGFYLPEDIQAGSLVGAIAATDPDAGQFLTYEIAGEAANLFNIDAAGQLRVNNPELLANQPYELTITVTDNAPIPLSDTAQIMVAPSEDQLPESAVIDLTGTEFTIFGTDAGDTITGTSGNDAILAGLGSDMIAGADGDDIISGSRGDDIISGNPGDDTILAGLGNDEVGGGTGNDRLNGRGGNDFLNGRDDHDLLLGGEGDDTLIGEEGDDSLYGEAGADILVGQQGQDILVGGSGNDQLASGKHRDQLFGGSGDDLLQGRNGFDDLFGGTGNDTLLGGNGEDRLVGTEHVNRGRGERDSLTGGDAIDIQADTFVLGDTDGVYYDDGDITSDGHEDFALITDFNASFDILQLSGLATEYRLEAITVEGIPGTGIFWEGDGSQTGELIGLLQSVNAASLVLTDNAQFEFV